MKTYISRLKQHKTLHLALIITVAVLVLYFGQIWGEFIWDDEEQIVNNVIIHSLSNIPRLFGGSTFNTGGATSLTGVYYRPIMLASFSILYFVGRGGPQLFHIFQISLHIVCSLLLFSFLINLKRSGEKYLSNIPDYGIAFFALVFGIHPLNVESVAYISALQDVLYTFFGLFALWFATRSEHSINKRLILGFLSLLLAIFSKETAIMYLIIFAVFGWLFEFGNRFKYLATSIAVASLYFFIRIFVISVSFGKYDISPIASLSLAERLLTVPKVIWYYVVSYLYPTNLSVMQHWVVRVATFADFWIPLIILIIIFITISFLVFKTKSKILFFFFIWSILGVGIHAQLFPLDMTVATRWIYSGMIGFTGVAILMLRVILNYFNTQNRKIGLSIFLSVWVILLMFITHNRLQVWKNGFVLYSTDIEQNPESFDLNNNYGVGLFRVGQKEKSLKYFLKSIDLQSNWAFPWNNAGAVYEYLGDVENAKKFYKKSIEIGSYFLAFENYASILVKEEKYEEALIFVNDSLRYLPMNQKLNYLKAMLEEKLRE